MTFSLKYKGFDYVSFYNGGYENSDSLASLVQTGANSIEATLDYGINVATSQVVTDPNYTDSLAALGDTIAQAESLGLSVMVRPLIDFLNPTESAPYSVGDWRQDYQPTNVAAFFASYQQMIVQEAKVAQANGAQMLSIGAELDQLAGPQYLSYWTDIISAVRGVFTGALTYSASWNTAGDVSFWSQLNFEGIDCYVPLSNTANPTLQNLVNGWLEPATEASNPGAYAVIGNQSPIQYFQNLSAQSGLPLLFTELGYANDTGAAADPSASGNSPDPALQAALYQAFFQAWEQSGSSSLIGAYFWEWDPDGSTSNVGPNIDSFSPQNSPAQNKATIGFSTSLPHAAGDFSDDGISDVLWINPTNNTVDDWLMNNGTPTWNVVGQGSSTVNIEGFGDFTGNGTADVLWENPANGVVGDWLMNNNQPTWQQIDVGSTTMNIAGVGDFNRDGTSDILWQNPTNNFVGIWQMQNNVPTWEAIGYGSTTVNIAGVGDFTGTGKDDILWENPSNDMVGMWAINGSTPTWSQIGEGSTTMNIVGTGDFTGKGTDDILWENPTNGTVGFWGMNNGQIASWNVVGTASTAYQVAGIGDYYGNGTDDILWRNPTTGDTGIWQMNNGQATWHDLGIASLTVNPVKA